MSLRLVKVPDAAPPYDCPTHGAGCPAMDAAAAASRSDPTRDPGPRPVPATGSGTLPAAASAPRAPSAGASAPSAPSAAGFEARRGFDPGPRGYAAVAVRPGDRGNHGGPAAAETNHRADHRSRPRASPPTGSAAGVGPAARDSAHRDVAAHGPGGGDDRHREHRTPVTRAGHAPGAHRGQAGHAGPAWPSGPLAVHRDRGGLGHTSLVTAVSPVSPPDQRHASRPAKRPWSA